MRPTQHLTAAIALTMLAACTPTPQPDPQPEPGCAPEVRHDQLPEWARTGFSEGARVPYSLGRSGRIVAVLFGYPLTQPPVDGKNNKILWVASPAPASPKADPPPSADLVIEARLAGRGDPVRQEVDGGPGPSIVDVPGPGCWRMSLSWSGRTDTIDVEYATP